MQVCNKLEYEEGKQVMIFHAFIINTKNKAVKLKKKALIRGLITFYGKGYFNLTMCYRDYL